MSEAGDATVSTGATSCVGAAWPWQFSWGERASKGKAPEAPADSTECSRDWSKSSSSTECASSRDWSKSSSSTEPSSWDWPKPSSMHLLENSAEQELQANASTDQSPSRQARRTAGDGLWEWPSVGGPQFGVAVVRHAERADEAWDSRWLLGEESKRHPFDPPITAKGGQQAQQVALELCSAGGFHRVVSSPYLRCVQTALVIAERLDLPVELDHELGEIYGPTIFGHNQGEEPVARPWRSPEELMRALGDLLGPDHPSLARICPDNLTGRMPQWPEAPSAARCRCASSFRRYVQQARETEWGCVLVSHAYMVQASLSVFPPTSSWTLASIGYCGTLVGRLRCPVIEDADAEPDPAAAAAVPQKSGEAVVDFDVIDFRTFRVKVADPVGPPRRLVTKARSDWGARRASEEDLVKGRCSCSCSCSEELKDLSSGLPGAPSILRRRSDLAGFDLGGSSLARRRGLEAPMGKSLSENPGGSSLARRRGFEVPMGKSFSE